MSQTTTRDYFITPSPRDCRNLTEASIADYAKKLMEATIFATLNYVLKGWLQYGNSEIQLKAIVQISYIERGLEVPTESVASIELMVEVEPANPCAVKASELRRPLMELPYYAETMWEIVDEAEVWLTRPDEQYTEDWQIVKLTKAIEIFHGIYNRTVWELQTADRDWAFQVMSRSFRPKELFDRLAKALNGIDVAAFRAAMDEVQGMDTTYVQSRQLAAKRYETLASQAEATAPRSKPKGETAASRRRLHGKTGEERAKAKAELDAARRAKSRTSTTVDAATQGKKGKKKQKRGQQPA